MSTRQPRYGDIFAGRDDGEAMAEQARVLWARYKANLEERGLFNDARAATLDRLVRASVEYETHYPIAVANGPVSKGPNGGDSVNMLWSMVQKLSDQIGKLEKALTLTPEAVGDKTATKGNKGKPVKGSGADSYLGAH